MEVEKQTLSKEIDLNEMIENERIENEMIENEMVQNNLETQNDCEKCLPKKGRKKLIGLTTVIFCTLVISVVIAIIHFSTGK